MKSYKQMNNLMTHRLNSMTIRQLADPQQDIEQGGQQGEGGQEFQLSTLGSVTDQPRSMKGLPAVLGHNVRTGNIMDNNNTLVQVIY